MPRTLKASRKKVARPRFSGPVAVLENPQLKVTLSDVYQMVVTVDEQMEALRKRVDALMAAFERLQPGFPLE